MKNLVFLAIVSLLAIFVVSCESKSGKRVSSTPIPSTSSNDRQVHSIPIQPVRLESAQSVPPVIIGVPKSISYAIELDSWNLSLDIKSEGYAYNLAIDSVTAMRLLTDKKIIAVKVKEGDITLLRE